MSLGVAGCHRVVRTAVSPPRTPCALPGLPALLAAVPGGTGGVGTPRGAGDTEMRTLGTLGGGIGDTGVRIRGRWDGSTGTAWRKVLGTLGRDTGRGHWDHSGHASPLSPLSPRPPRAALCPPGLRASVSPTELSPSQPGGAGVSPPAPRPLRAPVTMPGVPLPFVLLILIPGGAAPSFPRDLVARSTVGLAGELGAPGRG